MGTNKRQSLQGSLCKATKPQEVSEDLLGLKRVPGLQTAKMKGREC
ncbi:hypothetical protein Nmel_010527 [Mimus melanotis]